MTITLSNQSEKTLSLLSREEGRDAQAVLESALEEYAGEQFFRRFHADYARLAADKTAWAEEVAERSGWDATLADGNDDEYSE